MQLESHDMRVALLEQRVITLEGQTQHLKFLLSMVATLVRDRLTECVAEVAAGNAAFEELTRKVEELL